MSRFTPQKAVRTGQKARVALSGPSGSGKTYTALTIAQQLGDTILVVDTERGSSSLYSDEFSFDVIEWAPPFDPRELAQVIAEQAAAYDVLVIDSLSHFWMGEGGTLDIVDTAAAKARGNSYVGWAEGTPAQDRMVQAVTSAPCHLLATMRAKTEYVLEMDSRGKQVPKKVGLAPVQRNDLDFEFTVTVLLDHAHSVVVDKSRCRSIADRVFKAGEAGRLGEELASWLSSAQPAPERVSAEQAKTLIDGMDSILDQSERRQVKADFVREFGTPQLLSTDRFDEATAWVASHLSAFDERPFDEGNAA